MRQLYSYSLLCIVSFLLVCGCNRLAPMYQKVEPIPQNAWNYNYKPVFKFDITDTTAKYRTYFVIQHTQAYAYCNLWLWMYVKTPGDTVVKKERVNITLAESNGKWLGRGMGDIWEQRMEIVFGDAVKYNRAGTYEIALEQNMRVNPLTDILHVGMRVEKFEVRR